MHKRSGKKKWQNSEQYETLIPRGQKQSCCEKAELHLVPGVQYNILLLGKRALCITFG